MKIAVMTDSTACLPKELTEKYNIYTIPLSVIFGNESYEEEVELSVEEFKEKLSQTDEFPKSSQPPIGQFIEMFEEIQKTYDAVISIHLSGKISGTYRTAISAGNMVPDLDVHVYDTGISAMMQGFYVIEAAKMAQTGATIDDIIKRLNEMRTTSVAYFMVDDLHHLQRGGRLSRGGALIGSLLQIKPILHFEEDEICLFEKVRTRKRAIRRIIDLLKESQNEQPVKEVVIIHSELQELADNLYEEIQAMLPDANVSISYFSPVLLTHLGTKSLGIGWYT